ncbi:MULTISPECIES: sulfotransferase [unclassified Okeania]|nr:MULTISPECIES: sulfotransferase [unclassified Okeania]
MMTEKIISRTLETPFLIVGCPRSGTTLLQIIIDAHPNIIIPPESHIFERFSDIFNYYGDLQKDSNLYLFVKDILQD